MTLYHYKALSIEGRKTAGVINADSFEMAKEHLRKQKILVTALSLHQKKSESKQLHLSQLLTFTRDIKTLLGASSLSFLSGLRREASTLKIAHPFFRPF